MSLTDDWKAGKLSHYKIYYVRMPNGTTDTESRFYLQDYLNTKDADEMEILDEVPSYEELQVLRKTALKYNYIKENGFYPGKIREYQAKIKHLKDLQACQDKEVEKLTSENEALELKVFELQEENKKANSNKNWSNARAKNLLDKNKSLTGLLKECRCMLLFPFIRAEYPNGDVITRMQLIDNIITRINAVINESEEKDE